jgi:hypothetical protein
MPQQATFALLSWAGLGWAGLGWAGLGTVILAVMGRALSRTRTWGPGDLAGGPVDHVLAQVRCAAPGLIIERLMVTRAGDGW